ncbi:MAG: sigma-70 family RNA polymerase sigma factor [Pseudomonadota bacterium]
MSSPNNTGFAKQVLAHTRDLLGAALRFTKNENDAEDLVQETMLKAFVAWESFEPDSNCRAWLLRIMTNTFINECRRLARDRRWKTNHPEDLLVSYARQKEAWDPENFLLDMLTAQKTFLALQTIPEPFQTVIALADLDGLRYREISRQLDCPLGTIMSRLHRGRRMLAKNLFDQMPEEQAIPSAA